MASRTIVGWIDFRKDDLRRAREFIRSMEDEGVLDELGFLALQSAFADRLYPATSTLMTAARYLYFVAAMYRSLEHDRVGAAHVDELARRKMDQLRDALSRHESVGVIGRDKKLEVKRPPSAIYWNALRLLGMFTQPLSEAAYQGRFDDIRSVRHGYADDDRAQQASDTIPFWDPDLPPATFLDAEGIFRRTTSFDLTVAEASDLRARFRSRFPDSLLTHLLTVERHEVAAPWVAPRPPSELAAYLRHAEALSLFARGTTIHYYSLACDARESQRLSVPEVRLEPVLEVWWEAARPILKNWRPEELLTLPDVAPSVRPGDVSFIQAWIGRVVAASRPKALLGDAEARDLVRAREIAVKPTKARLKHRKHLEQWGAPPLGDGPHQLDYRHRIGTRFVREILAGIRGHA